MDPATGLVILIFMGLIGKAMLGAGKAVTSNKRAVGIGMSLLERWLK